MDNKKSLIALALVVLVGIIGGTFVYFASSATLINEFTPGTYSTSVTEEFVSPDNWTPGITTVNCANLTTGYAGATYSLDITIETIQSDKKWEYTAASTAHAYKPGDEITVAGEKFNVIKDNGDTVTMLAQYNLDSTYKQSETSNEVIFSNSYGWEFQPGPKEIDIQQYGVDVKTYVNN